MGPGARSADTPCGNTGGTVRSVAGPYGFNSEAGSARNQPQGGRYASPARSFLPSFVPPSLSTFCIPLPPARAAGAAHGRAPCGGRGRQPPTARRKGGNGGPRECRGAKQRSGEPPQGRQGPKAGIPLPPCIPGSPAGARGGEAKEAKSQNNASRRGGNARRCRAGEKAAKGPTGRAPPQGGRAARWTRRAAFFSHSLEGVGTPAAHCGAGPHAGRRRGPHGDATSRPRGPPARHATAGPLGRSTGHERRRPAHGTPPGHPPRTRRDTPQRAPLTCHSGSRHGGRTELAEFGPNGTTEPTPARIGRARAEGTRRRGCGGPPPRASRPEPP